jgi:predicted amidohydrolase YtcJ
MSRVALRNGSVYSPAAARATAICFDGERVTWVGDDDGVLAHLDGAEEVVDLHGRLVTPAFVDAHAHLAQTGLALRGLDLGEATSVGDALQRLELFARSCPSRLVLGFGWDETRWPEQRGPTGAEVDRAVGSRPAYLARVDVHSAIVSSALAAAAPAMRERDGWDGTGRVEREAHHVARDAANGLVPESDRRDAVQDALLLAASMGIGAVHELGAPHLSRQDDFAAIEELRRTGAVPHVVGYWGELGAVQTARALDCMGAAGDLCCDGAVGSRTAAVTIPYADDDTTGHLYLSAEEVRDHVVACTRAGLQAGFHAIGDRSVTTVVDGLRAAAGVVGGDAMVRVRHRLEHVEMIEAEQIATLADLGVVASVQPVFDALWGGEDAMYAVRLGATRSLAMNPLATMARAGVRLAFGSDTPVTQFDPWGAVRAAAWHHNPAERLRIPEAFAAHTCGGWYAARCDDGGTLVPGGRADYAIWDVDPEAADNGTGLPNLHPDLPLPRCLRTVAGGREIFDLQGALE